MTLNNYLAFEFLPPSFPTHFKFSHVLLKKKNSSKVVYSLHLSTIIPTSQCFQDRERGFFFLITKKQLGKQGLVWVEVGVRGLGAHWVVEL